MDSLVREWHMWAYINNGHILNAVPEHKETPEYRDIIKRINDHIHYLEDKEDFNSLSIFVNNLNSLSVFANNIKIH